MDPRDVRYVAIGRSADLHGSTGLYSPSMPRRHTAARERPGPPPPRERKGSAPPWAASSGFDVRVVTGDKSYRCPGCDHEIRPGLSHLVVVPAATPSERRHWHTNCW